MIIAAIVVFSVVLDIVRERRAEATIDALRRSVAVTAAIRRDGIVSERLVRDIVPGDFVELHAGDLVPGRSSWSMSKVWQLDAAQSRRINNVIR